MNDKNPFGIDIGSIGDAFKGLQDAYAGGLGAMSEASAQATEDMVPTHKIIVNADVKARVENIIGLKEALSF